MIFDLGERRPRIAPTAYVAANATVIGLVTLGEEASVWFNAVVRGDNDDILIGAGSNIQDCAVLHTDPGFPLTIGRGVSVGHLAMLHGCTVHDDSLIGINAVVLNGAVIGTNCIVGANSLVPEGRQIPPGSLVVGTPARVIRPVGERELALIRDAAQSYVDRRNLYRDRLVQRG